MSKWSLCEPQNTQKPAITNTTTTSTHHQHAGSIPPTRHKHVSSPQALTSGSKLARRSWCDADKEVKRCRGKRSRWSGNPHGLQPTSASATHQSIAAFSVRHASRIMLLPSASSKLSTHKLRVPSYPCQTTSYSWIGSCEDKAVADGK